jgi:hypothetical protein
MEEIKAPREASALQRKHQLHKCSDSESTTLYFYLIVCKDVLGPTFLRVVLKKYHYTLKKLVVQ